MNISLKPVLIFLKKYSAMVPSIAITLVSLLIFVPLMMIGGSVKKSMNASIAMAHQVQSELSEVPSRDKPGHIKVYMDKLEEDTNKIEKLALQSGLRDLITYDYVIFPKPTDSSAQIFQEFGRKYRAAIEEMLTGLKAKDAPSEAEIQSKTGQVRDGSDGSYPQRRNVNTDPMIDVLCLSRAKEISVYAHMRAFAWYEFWEKYQYAGENQALQDCWNSQIAFWIYQDIVDTIQKMNGSNSTVDASAVKRLVGVSFSGPVILSQEDAVRRDYGRSSQAATQGRDIPNYVTASLTSNFLEVSPTGRIGDGEKDIVHFAVSVLVDNGQALEFMKQLCSEKTHSYHVDFSPTGEKIDNARHNQISILESNIRVVDPKSQEHYLYRYGKAAVMQLDLVCEYQFNRKSYDSLKPAPIQQLLTAGDSNAATSL